MKDDVIRIKVQDKVHELDFDGLSWGELEEIEGIMGCALEDANFGSAKGVLCLAFIAARKDDQLITLDSLRALPMDAIELVEGDQADPTSAVEGDGVAESSGNPS